MKTYLSKIFVALIISALFFLPGCGSDGASGVGGFVNIPTPTPTELPNNTISSPAPTAVTVNLPENNNNNEIPSTTPSNTLVPKSVPHLYPANGLDPNESIETVSVIAGFFVASDIQTEISWERKHNLQTVIDECRTFWQREFDGEMNFVPSILWTPIEGDCLIAEYNKAMVIEEFNQKTEYYNLPGCYNIKMIYVVRDDYEEVMNDHFGPVPEMQAAVLYEFMLDDQALSNEIEIVSAGGYREQYGIVCAANFIGHLFGFPDVWDLPKEVTGGDSEYGYFTNDIMAYPRTTSEEGLLKEMKLHDYMKKVVMTP